MEQESKELKLRIHTGLVLLDSAPGGRADVMAAEVRADVMAAEVKEQVR